jgi:hypothetical protein
VDEDESGDFFLEVFWLVEVKLEGALADFSVFDPFLKFDIRRKRGILLDEFDGSSQEGGDQEIAIGEPGGGSLAVSVPAGEIPIACCGEEQKGQEETTQNAEPSTGLARWFIAGWCGSGS